MPADTLTAPVSATTTGAESPRTKRQLGESIGRTEAVDKLLGACLSPSRSFDDAVRELRDVLGDEPARARRRFAVIAVQAGWARPDTVAGLIAAES